MKILVVEDEINLNNIIVKYLEKNSFSVDSVLNGQEALEYIKDFEYDLILLDIMMPKLDGLELLKILRNKKNKTPIIFLTAKDMVIDKIKGLNFGADDYITKPFDFEELLARINANIRRKFNNSSNILTVYDLILNRDTKTVIRKGKIIELTAKEYEILEYLMQSKNKILSREQIKNHTSDYYNESYSNTIEVLIKNIRKKITLNGSKQIIYTKRGLGYVIKDDEE